MDKVCPPPLDAMVAWLQRSKTCPPPEVNLFILGFHQPAQGCLNTDQMNGKLLRGKCVLLRTGKKRDESDEDHPFF